MALRGDVRMKRKTWRRWWLALLTLAVLAGMAPGRQPTRAQGDKYHVLLLHSYHDGLSWTDRITEGVTAVLLNPLVNPAAEQIELYIDYMDTKRIPPEPEHLQAWYELLRTKYQDITLDVIIVADNIAFDFLREYHADLFPNVPVIFCGINFFTPRQLEGLEQSFSGVSEDVDIRATLDLALTLHPNTRQVIVVNDDTVTGQILQEEIERIRPEYENRPDAPLRFINLVGLSATRLRATLREQPSNSIVLMVLLNRDGEGRFFTYEEGILWVRGATSLPIYGLWDFYLGYGLLGGRLANGFSQGEAAGEMALRVLQGERVANLPIRSSPNRYMFDYEQMRRLGITQTQLPGYSRDWPGESSDIYNMPPSFTERYGAYLLAAAVSLVVGGIILAIQSHALRKQRRIQAEVEAANQALEATRVSLEQRVTERTQDLARRSEQLELAAIVARDVSGIQDVDQLMRTIVELISQAFGFYHAAIFLLDESEDYAVLHAVSSEPGREMLARGYRLRVAEQSLVGYVAARGDPRVAEHVGGEAAAENLELPETRSEMALPLKLRGRVIGVLDVQSTEPAAFSEEDSAVLQIMADQLTLAIHNARLFAQSRAALARLESMYGERVRQVWTEQVSGRAYRYDGVAVTPLESLSLPSDPARHLVVPLSLGDLNVGAIVLEREEAGGWSSEEVALAQAVSVQAGLALENARLLAETQARAEQERLIGDISARIRETLDIDTILQVAARQFQAVLGLDKVEIRVGQAEVQEEQAREGER